MKLLVTPFELVGVVKKAVEQGFKPRPYRSYRNSNTCGCVLGMIHAYHNQKPYSFYGSLKTNHQVINDLLALGYIEEDLSRISLGFDIGMSDPQDLVFDPVTSMYADESLWFREALEAGKYCQQKETK